MDANNSDNEDEERPNKIQRIDDAAPSLKGKKKLFVILENANLETVKIGKIFELRTEKHANKYKDDINNRPDILHQCLLMLLDSPLNRSGLLQIYIHTVKNVLIEVSPRVRIPRTFARFSGLMVQLLHRLYIKANDGSGKLLKVVRNPVTDHLPPGSVKVCLSHSAEDPVRATELVPRAGDERLPVLVIGAMAHGKVDVDYTERDVSISHCPLSAALSCAKVCSAFEEKWDVL